MNWSFCSTPLASTGRVRMTSIKPFCTVHELSSASVIESMQIFPGNKLGRPSVEHWQPTENGLIESASNRTVKLDALTPAFGRNYREVEPDPTDVGVVGADGVGAGRG